MKKLFCLVALLLAGCASGSWMDTRPATTLPILVMEFENADGPGQVAEIAIQTREQVLAQFIQTMVARGYYHNQYFYREVPGAYLLTGKARLSGRPTVAGPFLDLFGPEGKKRRMPPETGANGVGMVVHVDGTVGPELMLHYGSRMWRDRQTMFANVAVGRIVRGHDALAKVRKGDKVQRVYFKP